MNSRCNIDIKQLKSEFKYISVVKKFIQIKCCQIIISKNDIIQNDFCKKYNAIINKNVKDIHGVYIWHANNEITYIGKGGSIKTDGTLTKHSVKERLVASRKKSQKTGKYITTNQFIKNLFSENKNWNKLTITIIYPKNKNIPVAFIESNLLFNFYNKNKHLPRLNKMY